MTTLADKLTGIWYNQLGSEMKLIAHPDGALSGRYKSAVGEATDFYVLTGRFDTAPPSTEGVSLGWAVSFQNNIRDANSTTTWSGQYYQDTIERILTQWLNATSTKPANNWSSTRVGNDTFSRIRPSEAEIAIARAMTVGSPHAEELIAMRMSYMSAA